MKLFRGRALAEGIARDIPSTALIELFFLPPFAIARLGGSDVPLDNFHWIIDPDIHSGGRTVIAPAYTIDIDPADGTPSTRMPTELRFSENGCLRPVAPFFELWVRRTTSRGVAESPLTLCLLQELRLQPGDIQFRVTVANKKSQRRTQLPSCGYIASATARGNDHTPKKLLAASPSDPLNPPLVLPESPVPLGSFQVVRPMHTASADSGDAPDLSVMRVRFTPGKGEVYGPRPLASGASSTTASIPSNLPEGQEAPWDRVMQGRMHQIVRPENRILNSEAALMSYLAGTPDETDPQPYDSYDGAKNGSQLSLGVVDDVCDGLIEAHLVVAGRRYSAQARISVGPPDFAPDRRHFVSAADDLADRDRQAVDVDENTLEETEAEIADLLTRVFETAGLINLDAERVKFLDNQCLDDPAEQPPATSYDSLTINDGDYANIAANAIPAAYATVNHSVHPRTLLPFTDLAALAHGKLAERHYLLQFLRTRGPRVRKLVRPAYFRLHELKAIPDHSADPGADYKADIPPRLRDARVARDGAYDMRMPPYMRDADDLALSLTRRQYDTLMRLLDHYEKAFPGKQDAPAS